MIKIEDKDGKYHGKNRAISMCEWTMTLLVSLDIDTHVHCNYQVNNWVTPIPFADNGPVIGIIS